jgi:hypothetical protein
MTLAAMEEQALYVIKQLTFVQHDTEHNDT